MVECLFLNISHISPLVICYMECEIYRFSSQYGSRFLPIFVSLGNTGVKCTSKFTSRTICYIWKYFSQLQNIYYIFCNWLKYFQIKQILRHVNYIIHGKIIYKYLYLFTIFIILYNTWKLTGIYYKISEIFLYEYYSAV